MSSNSSWNSILCTRSEIALRLMPQNLTNYKSTLVQVMACCCQATSHYLGQCWLKSVSPYVFTRPQCTTFMYKMYTKSVILTKGCSVKPHKHLLINSYHTLTLKHRETHGCVVSTVATDALVLKHQAISIHNTDQAFIVLDQFHIKIPHLRWTISRNKITFLKKWPSRLGVKGALFTWISDAFFIPMVRYFLWWIVP